MSSSSKVILVGNGFDLAHGLKTGYLDFMSDYWEKQMAAVNQVKLDKIQEGLEFIYHTNEYYVHAVPNVVLNANTTGQTLHFGDIEEFKRAITYKNSFLKALDDVKRSFFWSGVEELYNEMMNECLNCIDNERIRRENPSIVRLNREFFFFKEQFISYLEEFYRWEKLQTLLKKSEYQSAHQSLLDFFTKDKPGKVIFLNFCYTNTPELYREDIEKEGIEFVHIHLHGQLKKDQNGGGDVNPIIFGYGDEKDVKSDAVLNTKINDFLENDKAVQYGVSGSYSDYYEKVIQNGTPYEVYVMGHSCAACDRTLLNELFSNEFCRSIRCFSYNGRKDFEIVTANIYRTLNKEHNQFRKILKPFSPYDRIPQFSRADQDLVLIANNTPFVMVKVKDDLYMGQFQVTQELWNACSDKPNPSYFHGRYLPVEQVTLADAEHFCSALNENKPECCYKKPSFQIEEFDFCIPTKEEWESAFNAPNAFKYSGSDDLIQVGWCWKNSGDRVIEKSKWTEKGDDCYFDYYESRRMNCRSHEVGGKKPNAYGIYDMSGNVWEWCTDSDGNSVLKGGGWESAPDKCTCKCTFKPAKNDFKDNDVGFRIALRKKGNGGNK